ncbi:16S rRNA (cytidine(1402)-2'-O)-methyltransferase, partial [Myxococcota bacterium]|nr:16S rRNA (cytidine(1402)-2'-O)-methyltransferase [Myxococcota bacterium]
PRKVGARRRLLETYAQRAETIIIFEAANRLAQTLSLLVEVFGGDRPACVARELTKLHEDVVRGDLETLAKTFSESVRGEITLVVEGTEATRELTARLLIEEEEVDRRILQLTQDGKRPREIAAQLSSLSELPRREIYARAVSAREEIGSKGTSEEGTTE